MVNKVLHDYHSNAKAASSFSLSILADMKVKLIAFTSSFTQIKRLRTSRNEDGKIFRIDDNKLMLSFVEIGHRAISRFV